MSNYYRRNSGLGFEGLRVIANIVIVVIFLVVCFYRPFNKVSDMRDVTVTVTDKVVKNDGNNSKYLVFTEDISNGTITTFEITDSWLNGRFNSSDVYAAIKIGNTYTFTVGGSRNEFMSWYPNIYEYELVDEK